MKENITKNQYFACRCQLGEPWGSNWEMTILGLQTVTLWGFSMLSWSQKLAKFLKKPNWAIWEWQQNNIICQLTLVSTVLRPLHWEPYLLYTEELGAEVKVWHWKKWIYIINWKLQMISTSAANFSFNRCKIAAISRRKSNWLSSNKMQILDWFMLPYQKVPSVSEKIPFWLKFQLFFLKAGLDSQGNVLHNRRKTGFDSKQLLFWKNKRVLHF